MRLTVLLFDPPTCAPYHQLGDFECVVCRLTRQLRLVTEIGAHSSRACFLGALGGPWGLALPCTCYWSSQDTCGREGQSKDQRRDVTNSWHQ